MNVKLTLKMTGMIFSKLKLFIVDLLMMGLAGAPLGFTIYRRFVNPSKTPRSLFENTTEDQGLLYLWLFTIFLVLWIYYCWRLWFYREKDVNIAEDKDKAGFFKRKFALLRFYIDEGTDKLYNVSTYISPNYGDLLNILSNWLHNNTQYVHHLVITLVCIPKIVVAIFFIVDVLYFKRFEYFYLSLYLLLLPLIYRLLTYLLQKFYDQNYPRFEEILIIKELGTDADGIIRKLYDFRDETLRAEYDLLHYLINVFDPIDRLIIYLKALRILKDRYGLYTNIFVYSMYSIGWGCLAYSYFFLS
jgi:hypothetical protein